MVKKIEWSDRAKFRFQEITKYLLLKWGEKVASDFIDTIESKLELLSVFPLMGAKTSQKNRVRKLLLSKHNRLFYEVKGDTIYLITIFDTRSNYNSL